MRETSMTARMRSCLAVLACFVAVLGLVAVDACSSDDHAGSDPTDAAPSDDAGVASDAHTLDAPPDGPSGSTAFHRSGSRLRAEVVRAGDAVRFERFFDTQRNETCTFQETSPGEVRCLPVAVTAGYADATCGSPSIAVLHSCTKDSKYASMADSTSDCDARYLVPKIFLVGAAIADGDSYMKEGGETCALVPRSPGDGSTRHALGPAIPLAEFVKATISRVSVSADLAVERFVGEDGSELTRGVLVDRTRDAGCGVAVFGPPNARASACIPDKAAHADDASGRWANASCTEPAAFGASTPGCVSEGVVLRHSRVDAGAGCTPGFMITLFERGAPLATSYEGAACTPVTTPPPFGTFAIGAALSPAAFPGVDEPLFGTGRVRTRAFAKSSVQLTNGALYDVTAQSYCAASPFSDGKLYCVAGDVRPYGFKDRFKDQGCTQPVYLAEGCSPSTTLVEATYGCEGTSYDANVLPLGAPFELSTYYEKSATCDPKPNDQGALAYDVLPPVPAAGRLPEVTRVRE